VTDQLIDRLVAEAGPVRRLRPPAIRAALWLGATAALGALAAAVLGDPARHELIARDPRLLLETAAIIATAAAAVIAAFHLAVPGRSATWMLAPLPFLALWLAVSGYGCLVHVDSGSWRESRDCFVFLVSLGAPLGASLFLLLRRAAPLAPVRVGLMGALGAAASAAALLQFFHPFDVTWIDLGTHAVAITSVLAAARLASGWLGRARGAVP
jgi:hypothetical protein